MKITICPICREVYEIDADLVGQPVECSYCGAGFQAAASTPCSPGPTVLTKWSIASVNLFSQASESLMRNTLAAFAAAGICPDQGQIFRFLNGLPIQDTERPSDYLHEILGVPAQTEAIRFYFLSELQTLHPRVRSMLIGGVLGVIRGASR